MYTVRVRRSLARAVADAFLAGDWTERAMHARGAKVLEPPPRWLRPVAREVLGTFPRPPADRPGDLRAIIEDSLTHRVSAVAAPRVVRRIVPQPVMGHRPWPVLAIASVAELATFVQAGHSELEWLADVRGRERSVTAEPLRHYRYDALPRRSGIPRVIERPKHQLKTIQRRLLHEILDWIPAHPAAHGFTRGRSVLTHAEAHVGQAMVLRLDLRDFFASVEARRIYGIFRTAGYPEAVAHTLTGLCTNVVSQAWWSSLPHPPDALNAFFWLGRRLATPHLPQGAPTSPALANLAAFGLDRRLAALAAACDVTYTRYADDLTFSGDHPGLRAPTGLRARVAAIAHEEGFTVNLAKTQFTTRAGSQRVCGVVVNERLNVTRRDYDLLKATLHNLRNTDPADEQLASLAGSISWVASLNPARGAKLQRELERVRPKR